MAGAERTDKTHPMAESFSEAKSALEEVLRFYKWGRHAKGFPEEIYLLLSRCAYLCFSLWQADQKSDGGFFHRSPPPGVFWTGLDFGELRRPEPGTGVLPADARDDPLTNDTKWFKFWLRILEQSDPRGASLYREFCEQILACVGHHHWLDIQTSFRSRKALHVFLQADQAGRVLLRTMAVLEDTIHAILRYFTTLDGRTCVLEKITLLTGVLSEMREIIVWETPARGPYAPSCDAHWRVRLTWSWLTFDRSKGILTVIPKRDGGEVLCTYGPSSNAKGGFSWTRQVSSLRGTYEETLFATWSYDTGEHRANPQHFAGLTACWTVQYAEAQRLETLARQVDLLLAALQGNPRCKCLVEAVRTILRNGASRWKSTVLPWTYVKELDQLLNKLTTTYRQANALGGGDATEHVVAQNWPMGEMMAPGAGPSRRQHGPDGEDSRRAVIPDETCTPGDVQSMVSDADRSAPDEPLPSSGPAEPLTPGLPTPADRLAIPSEETPVEIPVTEASEKPESSGQDAQSNGPAPVELPIAEAPEKPESAGQNAQSDSPAPVPEENPAPAASNAIGSLEPPPVAEAALPAEPEASNAEPAGTALVQEKPASKRTRRKKTTNTSRPEDMDDALLQCLLDHHGCLGGTTNYEPLSATELQRRLGWNASKVQRAMTKVFGPQPARVYRNKCQDRTIATFLKTCAAHAGQSAPSSALT